MPKRKRSPTKQPVVEAKSNKIYSMFEKNKVKKTTGTWVCNDKVWVYSYLNVEASTKIAGFDLDHTIIKPTKGSVYPKNDFDWEFYFDNIITELKALNKDGFKIVIFTNQKGISSKRNTNINVKNRVENIVENINIPLQVFISTGHPKYRKPARGMWDLLCSEYNENISINISDSFYVGDGAGRLEGPHQFRKDFTDSDKLFSLNIGINFKTPEEFFKKIKYKGAYFDVLFNPKKLFEIKSSLLVPENSIITSNEKEILLLVGITGSGKSFFTTKYFDTNNYHIITNSKKIRCNIFQNPMNVIEGFLNTGKNIVIDEENLDKSTRKFWIDIAKKLKINIRCFYFDLYIYHCCHNVAYKQIIGECQYDPTSKSLIKRSHKMLEPPKYEEGFKEIIKVNFHPSFDNEEHANIYKSYLPL
uniref:Bifunctional polynucleotide phosphatase/kinase n=1 Tax=Strongyloides stercoralis TaxID=6248 RepID=A0A0K0EE81_STRER